MHWWRNKTNCCDPCIFIINSRLGREIEITASAEKVGKHPSVAIKVGVLVMVYSNDLSVTKL